VGELEPDKDDHGRRKAKILQLGMVKERGAGRRSLPAPLKSFGLKLLKQKILKSI
jgi:hypothetical protein